MQCRGTNTQSRFYSSILAARDTYPVCNPQLDYIHSFRVIDTEEAAEALTYRFPDLYEETWQSFIECFTKHLMSFVKKESMNVTTVNSTEMSIGTESIEISHIFTHSPGNIRLLARYYSLLGERSRLTTDVNGPTLVVAELYRQLILWGLLIKITEKSA